MPTPQARYRIKLDPVAWECRAETERRAQGLTLWPADSLSLYPAPTPPAWLRAERDADLDAAQLEAAARDVAHRDHARWLAAERGSAATVALAVLITWALITAAALATVAPAVGTMLR